MLRDLHIRNLAVLSEATIRFGPGFNVLSGETGAGKSIVVDSLALLAGVRASADLIRTGAQVLTVTGVFEPRDERWRATLEAVGVEAEGDDLVIRREVTRAGRNRVFVNDQPVTLKLVAELAPSLLRIHGQREELGLVAPDLQRAWLDRCGGAAGAALAARTADAHAAYARLAERLARLTGDARLRHERIDLLRFQLTEIDDAQVEPGEEDSLRQERDTLRHSEAIRDALSSAYARLYEGDEAAYDALEASRQGLERIAAWEPQAAAWASELEELRIRIGELAGGLSERLDEVSADPGRLDAVESRLAILERLLRKHGESTAAVLARRRAMADELEELTGDEDAHEVLGAELEAAVETYRQAALALSEARAGWGTGLASRVHRELRDLALGRARFDVVLERRRREGSPLSIDGVAVEIAPAGVDQVVFRFSTNPGEALQPLAKVASGGELSRLYLAVQLAARAGDLEASPAALVFDEVDTGIGGAEAAALGEKLRRLARGGQILAVTHLPQVASHGDRQFKVSKAVKKGRTHTVVEPLDDEARAAEVARMLAGSEVTELSLSHARELIAGAAG